ncbi:unnamed protein product [Echinostoma caproni]|uniref:Transmembrane protein 231 n=1 Tax=Echinostoma caproni TaxID=27848 RepID=A0A183AR65_9TREM|nr:unnamed protein product [Echinostoma caproni]
MKVQEPFVKLAFSAFLAARGFAYITFHVGAEWINKTVNCDADKPVNDSDISAKFMEKIEWDLETSEINDVLWLYASKLDYDSRKYSFYSTMKFRLHMNPLITPDGLHTLSQTHYSPAFPDRFTQLNNQEIRVGVLLDNLFIKNYGERIGNELFDASGMAVDILEGMSKHFNFTARMHRLINLVPQAQTCLPKRPQYISMHTLSAVNLKDML